MITYYERIPEFGRRQLTVCPNQFGAGKVILVNTHGHVDAHNLETGTIIDELSVKPEYLAGCYKDGKLVYIGTWLGGGMGRPAEIDYRTEIKNFAGGESVDLSNPRYFNLLMELCEKDEIERNRNDRKN